MEYRGSRRLLPFARNNSVLYEKRQARYNRYSAKLSMPGVRGSRATLPSFVKVGAAQSLVRPVPPGAISYGKATPSERPTIQDYIVWQRKTPLRSTWKSSNP